MGRWRTAVALPIWGRAYPYWGLTQAVRKALGKGFGDEVAVELWGRPRGTHRGDSRGCSNAIPAAYRSQTII
ncbi:hypothetical protein BPO_1490 [Bergeyella porcorum]|uniref:Uncharacterized protein n=1 Tax=Bergeyella porcorum TaxID=1735111 RepID=A0AAU0F3E0_9FLAO